MKVASSPNVPTGMVALFMGLEFKWYGKLSEPWDDVECDTILVAAADYSKLVARLRVQYEERGEPD